jgi:mono/diheme cytochrome c family protein
MKFRSLAIIFTAILLSACNFSLAEDVTPPSNYIPPTPVPTLGPMFPTQAPDIDNGAAFYAVKCAACHGPTGMGDGDTGKQLPVTVAALALPQVGHPASPAEWYAMVTRGNIERSMPPFTSLSDQERWDVVAYALTLQTTPEQVSLGQSLFESKCAECSLDFFKNQEQMAPLSADDLVQLLKNGSEQVTALSGLSDDDLYAVAAYLRTLTFALPAPTAEPPAATPTVNAADLTSSPVAPSGSETQAATLAVTPGAEGTPAGTDAAASPVPAAAGGKVTGSVTGEKISGLTVTLRGYDHTSDTSGPTEVVTLTGTTDAAGKFTFENLEMPEARIFLAEVEYKQVTYSSETAVAVAGSTELTLPPLTLYETSTDYSTLSFDQVHFFIDISEGAAQAIGVYTFSNKGDRTIVIKSTTDIPFLKLPDGVENIGFDLTDNSAPILAAQDGFAIPPSEMSYGLVAYYTVPYDGKAQIQQPFVLPVSSLLVLVPDGVKLKSDQLTEGDVQNFQGMDYSQFKGGPLKAGDALVLDLSGTPKTSTTTSGTTTNQGLLIGIGALGLVLILAGVWMYFRDRNRQDDESTDEAEEQDEYENEEEILDAIIALDDLHRAGKIPEETYQSRRAELKSRLKS